MKSKLTLCIIGIPKKTTLANSEDPGEMPHVTPRFHPKCIVSNQKEESNSA